MEVERALEIIGADTFEEGAKFLETVKFGVVKLRNCNGVKSTPFSKAECEFNYFVEGNRIVVISFAHMFEKGMVFLKKMENVNEGRLEGTEKAALLCLGKFFDKKGKRKLMSFFLADVLFCSTLLAYFSLMLP